MLGRGEVEQVLILNHMVRVDPTERVTYIHIYLFIFYLFIYLFIYILSRLHT